MVGIELREFRVRGFYIYGNLAVGVFYTLLGLHCLFFKHALVVGFIFSAGGLSLLFSFFWRKAYPYVKIGNDGIIIFYGPTIKPKCVRWHSVKEIKFAATKIFGLVDDGGRIELLLSNNKTVKVILNLIAKKERQNLLRALRHGMADSHKQAGP